MPWFQQQLCRIYCYPARDGYPWQVLYYGCICFVCWKPGGTTYVNNNQVNHPGHNVPMKAENNLKLMAFYPNFQHNTSTPVIPVNITIDSVSQRTACLEAVAGGPQGFDCSQGTQQGLATKLSGSWGVDARLPWSERNSACLCDPCRTWSYGPSWWHMT